MTFEPYMVTGFVLIVFGWWGANTAAGIRLFPTPRRTVLPVAASVAGTAIFARGLWLFVRG